MEHATRGLDLIPNQRLRQGAARELLSIVPILLEGHVQLQAKAYFHKATKLSKLCQHAMRPLHTCTT